jgi:SAM-dependent methyltransferase
MPTVADLKRVHRATWAAGNYAAVAEMIDEAPPRDLLAKADVRRGQKVLDVAAGTGNVALCAAAAGAHVVGLDLTPERFVTARRRAAERGLYVDWVEGDAEELPFGEEHFDRVLSAFGVQFAPRHDTTAAELVRVCRPGGRIVVVNWTPESAIGELRKTIGGYMPAPPAFASPPPLWGSEEHVRRLFAGSPVDLEVGRQQRQLGGHVIARPVPAEQRVDGERVAQVMRHGPAAGRRADDARDSADSVERRLHRLVVEAGAPA